MKDLYQGLIDDIAASEMKSAKPGNDAYGAMAYKGWMRLFSLKGGGDSEQGWKFHISVDRHDLSKAWNIVATELMNDRIGHFAKVALPSVADRVANTEHHNAGKMMAIVVSPQHAPEDYMTVMQRIDEKLKAAGVKPGHAVKGDRNVPGSPFLFYRNDASAFGKYLPAAATEKMDEKQRYNPYNAADPFINFRLDETPQMAKSLFLDKWQAGMTEGGQMISRLPVLGMTTLEFHELSKNLTDLGYKPVMRQSDSLGMTLRLSGDDAKRLTEMQHRAQQRPKI